MPQLGESVVEGVIVRWLKQPGERVEVDEPLVEVDTDKVGAEIPSPLEGVVQRLLADEGDIVPVGEAICLIEVVEEGPGGGESPLATERVEPASSQEAESVPTGPAPSAEAAADREPGEEAQAAGAPSAEGSDLPSPQKERPHAYSPVVRQLAEEHGIDPASLEGTGIEGRVTKQDMLRAVAARAEGDAQAALRMAFGEDEIVPLTRMRRAIAAKMVQSKQTVPHAWTMVEVDVTNLVSWRESIKGEFRRREGVNLTYLPFVIKAAVEALKEFPIMNSMWQEDNIVIRRHINIGIAVDIDDGLVVPVIRDADQKSIAGIAKAVADLAGRARSGDLHPDEVQGGTFTINNTGAFGSIMSAPIINYPQAAILSMETITKRAVVIEDAIGIRSMVNLCVSLDHRILDGAVCGRFLRSVKRRLESYNKDMPLY